MTLPFGNFRVIQLSQGKETTVDAADYDLLSGRTWRAEKRKHTWYAVTTVRLPDGRRSSLYMHRLILGLTDKRIDTDHRDGNGLNNSRANLRPATRAQNNVNRHFQVMNNNPFRGVRKHYHRWIARVKIDGKERHVGSYASAEAAAKARDAAVFERYGDFERLNFPEQERGPQEQK